MRLQQIGRETLGVRAPPFRQQVARRLRQQHIGHDGKDDGQRADPQDAPPAEDLLEPAAQRRRDRPPDDPEDLRPGQHPASVPRRRELAHDGARGRPHPTEPDAPQEHQERDDDRIGRQRREPDAEPGACTRQGERDPPSDPIHQHPDHDGPEELADSEHREHERYLGRREPPFAGHPRQREAQHAGVDAVAEERHAGQEQDAQVERAERVRVGIGRRGAGGGRCTRSFGRGAANRCRAPGSAGVGHGIPSSSSNFSTTRR